jgi:hypothetical protein
MSRRPLAVAATVLLVLPVAACSEGGGVGRRDGGTGGVLDAGPGLVPECGEGLRDCPTGFVCAAVMGVPRCVPDPDRPPPGDGTDCRPCEAPGECRMGVCVQPSASGRVCEFDPECGMGELCIAGRCTPDPRIPTPCRDGACPAPFVCGPDGFCRCTTTTDCPIGLECMEGSCVPGPGGDACVADAECPADYVCEAGRCRTRTLCDIEHPDLAGRWMMTSTLRLREALPSWLSDFLDAVEEPFAFLGGTTTCIDWSGLPDWVDTAICDLVRPYLDRYLPPWSRPVFRAISDLNDVIGTWVVDETMTLRPGTVRDSYRGSHTWNRVTFMYRDMPVVGDPADILDWRFSPSDFNALAVCGYFHIERHPIHVSIGSIVAWLIDALIYEVSGHRWSGLRAALTDLADGFCAGLARAAEDNIDYRDVGSRVMSLCSSLVSAAIDRAIRAVLDARIGADAITLQGSAPISGPGSLRMGVWNGTLLGRGFTGDFDAWR